MRLRSHLRPSAALRRILITLTLVLATTADAMEAPMTDTRNARVHYVEIVSTDVDAQCALLERTHGLSFGPADPDLGQARTAQTPDGRMIGVRAPLAEGDLPVVRTYFEVEDMAAALAAAEAAGALVAYGPVEQGATGTWAIYFLGGAQMGLWSR